MSSNKSKKAGNPTFPVWLIVAAALVALLVIAGVSGIFSPGGGAYPAEIQVSQAVEKQKAGAFMLDVREPSEWVEYHMPGSTLIPLGDLPNRLSEVPKDKEVVVVCRSGNRSQQGRDILLGAGYKQVTSMAGGLKQWAALGNPTVSGQ